MEEESKLSKMKLSDIFKEIDMRYLDIDISFFCDDVNTVKKFDELIKKDIRYDELLEFFVENDTKIEKDKLVLYVYAKSIMSKNTIIKGMYRDFLEIKDKIDVKGILGSNIKIKSLEDFKKQILNNKNRHDKLFGILALLSHNGNFNNQIQDKIGDLLGGDRAVQYFNKQIIKSEELLEDVDINIIKVSDNGEKIIIDITNSKEEIEKQKRERIGKPQKSKKASPELDTLNKIGKEISSDGNGLEFIVQGIVLDDLKIFINDETVADSLKEVIALNALIRDGKYKLNNIGTIKEVDEKSYEKLINSISINSFVEELSDGIKRYSQLVDVDKLLMVSLYRFQEMMGKREITGETYQVYKYLCCFIKDKIENKELTINIKIKENSEEEREYSYKDIQDFTDGLLENKYVSKEERKQIKEDLLLGKVKVQDVGAEVLEILKLTEQEFKKIKEYIILRKDNIQDIDLKTLSLLKLDDDDIKAIMEKSIENTVYLVELAKLDEESIYTLLLEREPMSEELLVYFIQNNKISMDSVIDLYINKKIDLEFFKQFSAEIEISSEKLLDKIHKDYLDLKKNEEKNKEEKEQKLDAIIDIYKIVKIDGKSIEEQEEALNEVMYQIAEDFEDEEDILFYYNKGLVNLGIVAEWCGESTIEKLYNESKISKEDLINLSNQGKISGKFVEQILLVDGIQYDELMDLIIRGNVSEQKIVDLYMQGKIFDVDFEEMLNSGIISHEEYITATELRTQEKLEENAKIKLSPKLKDIPDKKGLLYSVAEKGEEEPKDWFTGGNVVGSRKKKLLIDPEMRFEFLKKLGAMEAEVLDINESNAFYNYDFFVIPNSMGEFDLNSVVIAERFYVNKETKDRFATDNATYFFQYKDLMVNSNLSKNEMTKERDKIVFRCAHRVENTLTSWGMNVLHNIAQTMLSTKFERCKTKQELEERTAMVLDQLHKFLTSKQISDLIAYDEEIEENGIYIVTDQDNVQQSRKKDSIDEGHGEL